VDEWRKDPFGSDTFPRVPRHGDYRGEVCCEYTFFEARIRYTNHFGKSLIDLALDDLIPADAVCDIAGNDSLALYEDQESHYHGRWDTVKLKVVDVAVEEVDVSIVIVWDPTYGATPLDGGLMITTFVSEAGPPDHWEELKDLQDVSTKREKEAN
jgi:hypothetical protein